MSLALCICCTDSCSSFLRLLSTCASPLSTFSILVTLHGLLGTLCNLELRKRKDVAKLAFNDVGPADLVGDVDVGHVRDAARNSPVCAAIFGEVSEKT